MSTNTVLAAEIALTNVTFHDVAVTLHTNQCTTATWTKVPGSSAAVTVNQTGGISITVPPLQPGETATAPIYFVLTDPNNSIVGAYFYSNNGAPITGSLVPGIEVVQSGDTSTLAISDALLTDSAGDTYNYVLIIQDSRGGTPTAGVLNSIGIIDPQITSDIGEFPKP